MVERIAHPAMPEPPYDLDKLMEVADAFTRYVGSREEINATPVFYVTEADDSVWHMAMIRNVRSGDDIAAAIRSLLVLEKAKACAIVLEARGVRVNILDDDGNVRKFDSPNDVPTLPMDDPHVVQKEQAEIIAILGESKDFRLMHRAYTVTEVAENGARGLEPREDGTEHRNFLRPMFVSKNDRLFAEAIVRMGLMGADVSIARDFSKESGPLPFEYKMPDEPGYVPPEDEHNEVDFEAAGTTKAEADAFTTRVNAFTAERGQAPCSDVTLTVTDLMEEAEYFLRHIANGVPFGIAMFTVENDSEPGTYAFTLLAGTGAPPIDEMLIRGALIHTGARAGAVLIEGRGGEGTAASIQEIVSRPDFDPQTAFEPLGMIAGSAVENDPEIDATRQDRLFIIRDGDGQRTIIPKEQTWNFVTFLMGGMFTDDKRLQVQAHGFLHMMLDMGTATLLTYNDNLRPMSGRFSS